MIVDIHTHAFPDQVAERAVPFLEEEGDITAFLDGTVASLLGSMDLAGIDLSVIASIATKPSQFDSILAWSKQIASDQALSSRLLPFPSVHPADPDAVARVSEIANAGLIGIKLHPYYQEFSLDERRMSSIFEAIDKEGLILLLHAGFDLAFPRDRVADPERIASLIDRRPGLRIIAAHLGGWEDWDEVERLLLGRKIYFDTSYSFQFLDRDRTRRLLTSHPCEYLLFGTDSPWGGQAEEIEAIRNLGLPPDTEAAVLGGNAERLLGLRRHFP